MTLSEFFQWMSQSPFLLIGYFTFLPIFGLLLWVISKGSGHKSPWRYLYSLLIYAVCIPGIIAIGFNLYLFLFERRSVMDSNIFFQICPILSMFLTLWLVRKNVTFDDIPGFDKISEFITIISCTLIFLWVLDKVHIISITFVPLWQIILLFFALIIGIRFAWKRLF